MQHNGTGVPPTMRAVVMVAPNRLEMQTVDTPKPGPMEVLCRVRAIGICGTDPHIISGEYMGRWPKALPFIPGHEWAGEVVALGPGAEGMGWAIGDRVAGTSHAGCGYCRMCTSGRYNLCLNYGREDLGHRQYGHYTNGCYADYVVHSIKSVHKLPPSLSFEEGALLDPASIALHAVKQGKVHPGDTVVVIGPGPIGALSYLCARAIGAARVIVVGRGPRLELLRKMGAETVDITQGDPVAAVLERTGIGADLCVDAAGTPETIRWSFDMVRKGGRVVLPGGAWVDEAPVPIRRLVLEEMEVFGCRANRGTCEEVIPLMSTGQIDVKPLITHRFPLAEYQQALGTLVDRSKGAMKVIMEP
ncbi:MAG: alcohol dehydrogenase catalytic domain-containing protein [Limnochordales bacterium]|nr:alcohol dehydrogenase catalytic domain-containing protein [Limnochordales bacterium]